MQLVTKAADGGDGREIEVADAAFGAAYNASLVHQVVSAFMAGARSGTSAQKTRAEVRGGGAKPWRQKGTGRARAGTSRSPIWRGGGVTFAARPRNYTQKVNRKMYRGAMRSILSELLRQDRLHLVEEFDVSSPKTRELVSQLQGLGVDDVLIVVEECGAELALASRNLHWVAVSEARDVNPASLLAFSQVLMTVAACRSMEERVA
jgi:large subunit ribosomal protein L4